MGGRELSEYGFPQPQTVDNDRFARVYHREIDYNQGEYLIDTGPDIIQLPENIGTFTCSIDELVSKVYPDLISNFRNMAWLSEWCILGALNETTRTAYIMPHW